MEFINNTSTMACKNPKCKGIKQVRLDKEGNEVVTYLPSYDLLDELTDTRNQSYITYDLKICLLVRILALCSGIQSMNGIGKDFNTDETIENINNILNENYIELPHKDTLTNVVNELQFEEL